MTGCYNPDPWAYFLPMLAYLAIAVVVIAVVTWGINRWVK